MKKFVIGFDFDKTLNHGPFPDVGEWCEDAIWAVKELYKDGHSLLLNTCRVDFPFLAAITALDFAGVLHCFTAINDNDPDRVARFGSNPRKLAVDFNIDDKNILGIPPMREVVEIIRKAAQE